MVGETERLRRALSPFHKHTDDRFSYGPSPWNLLISEGKPVDDIEADALMECIEILRTKVKQLERRCRRLEIDNGDYEEEQEAFDFDDYDREVGRDAL